MTDDLATERLDDVDATVLQALRDLHARLDPVPAGLTDDVKFALTVQALHAEVAELTRVGADEALVRSVDYTRAETLTFTGGPFTAMVSVVATGTDEVRIDGWVTGGPVRVELRERDRTRSVDVEDEGRFVLEGVHRGLVQFVLHPVDEGTKPVITPSIEL
ncbi:MAG: carboxypeptidase regulatory-like domain-containing protein [Micrococcales bacterium]|nr:carboxypeptidase regulatory-like domain-containing protein [Micrococcales bacterium]